MNVARLRAPPFVLNAAGDPQLTLGGTRTRTETRLNLGYNMSAQCNHTAIVIVVTLSVGALASASCFIYCFHFSSVAVAVAATPCCCCSSFCLLCSHCSCPACCTACRVECNNNKESRNSCSPVLLVALLAELSHSKVQQQLYQESSIKCHVKAPFKNATTTTPTTMTTISYESSTKLFLLLSYSKPCLQS